MTQKIKDALTAVIYWQECRKNFSSTQNRTEYDQAALDVCTGHAETIRTILQSALDAGGDAPKLVHTVYAVEDDFTHIFSTEQLAKEFADKKELPCVISTYLIDNPERFYEAVQ